MLNDRHAGGQVGKHVAEHLLKLGHFIVTAITRPISTSKLPEGIQVARVDYCGDDDAALVKALQGQQALIITMAVMAPPDTISKFIRAAAEANVAYVLPTWFGHDAANDALCNDSWLSPARDKNLAEIKDLEVSSYLLLCCNFWYEFSLAGGLDRSGLDPKTLLDLVRWRRCGRQRHYLASGRSRCRPLAESQETTGR